QAHHVGGAEGGRGSAAHLLAGQVVDDVVAQARTLDFAEGQHHAGHAHAVGDEVGGVKSAHHVLANHGGREGFQLVDHFGSGVLGGDQLLQRHVARRVEEVDAHEARTQLLGQDIGHRGDGQARDVGRQNGVLVDEGSDLLVEIFLPVQAFSDGFDDQVAATQLFEVFL